MVGVHLNKDQEDIYLKTFAIFSKMGVNPDEENFRQAFKFYWEGNRFRSLHFSKINDSIEEYSSTIKKMASRITGAEIARMKTALSDSYRTVSVAADISDLDKAMVKRIVENGEIRSVKVNNPYYKNSPSMVLVRMSDLRMWIERNPYAVSVSRKILERTRKAHETRKRNLKVNSSIYRKMVEDVMTPIEKESAGNPIPLLFLLLKLLQLKKPGEPAIRSYFNERLKLIVRFADRSNVTFREVRDLHEIEDVKLCTVCSKTAYFLGMTDEQYLGEVGKCPHCITVEKVELKGRHYELIYSNENVQVAFVIEATLFDEIRRSERNGSHYSTVAVTDTIRNPWDNISSSEIEFTSTELMSRIDSIFFSLKKRDSTVVSRNQ